MDVEGVALHVGVTGSGPDVLVLTAGPGGVQYLEQAGVVVPGHRCWFPEPRGVGRSTGGPHDMERAVADLEALRRSAGLGSWILLGHSWGSDLAIRYALDHPEVVSGVVGIAGKGLQRDRTWSEAYESGRASEPPLPVEIAMDVWTSLSETFTDWIHQRDLWRRPGGLPRTHAPHRGGRRRPTVMAPRAGRSTGAGRALLRGTRRTPRLLVDPPGRLGGGGVAGPRRPLSPDLQQAVRRARGRVERDGTSRAAELPTLVQRGDAEQGWTSTPTSGSPSLLSSAGPISG